MVIEIRKTFQIDISEWEEIVEGFNDSFAPHTTTVEKLVGSAKATHLGYSFHALCYIDSKIVGFNSILPHAYNFDNKEILIGLSGSTFILERYRQNITILNDMLSKLKSRCKQEGLFAIIAVPNSNSYLYFKRFARFSDVGKLNYYILPINLGKFHDLFNFYLQGIYSLFLRLAINVFVLAGMVKKRKVFDKRVSIEKSNQFLSKRFPPSVYQRQVVERDSGIIFRVLTEGDLEVCYLFGFYGKVGWQNFNFALKSIILMNKIDVVVFLGNSNPFSPMLFKLPEKFEPKNMHLLVFSLSENDDFNSVISQINNWDFSLFNLDTK